MEQRQHRHDSGGESGGNAAAAEEKGEKASPEEMAHTGNLILVTLTVIVLVAVAGYDVGASWAFLVMFWVLIAYQRLKQGLPSQQVGDERLEEQTRTIVPSSTNQLDTTKTLDDLKRSKCKALQLMKDELKLLYKNKRVDKLLTNDEAFMGAVERSVVSGHVDEVQSLVNSRQSMEGSITSTQNWQSTINKAVVLASEKGCFRLMKVLLEDAGADFNIENGLPLRKACESGCLGTIRGLVRSGANTPGPVLLSAVCQRKDEHLDIVEYLVEVYGDTIQEDRDFEGPSPLLLAYLNGHQKITSYLLQNLSKMTLSVDKLYKKQKAKPAMAALHFAAEAGDVEMTKVLLTKCGANANLLTGTSTFLEAYKKSSPLHIAVSKNYITLAAMLLELGSADANILNFAGASPLHLAKSKEMVQLLVSNNANIDLADSESDTPLMKACTKGKRLGSMELRDYILDLGAAPNTTNQSGETPLSLCAGSCYVSIGSLRQLINEYGASVENDTLALLRACKYNNREAALLLVEQGSNANAVAGPRMSRPLHWACANLDLELVDCLLNRNAEVNVSDQKGITPLHIASSHLCDGCCKHEKNGCKIPTENCNVKSKIACKLLEAGANPFQTCDEDTSPCETLCRFCEKRYIQIFTHRESFSFEEHGPAALVEAGRKNCVNAIRHLLTAGAGEIPNIQIESDGKIATWTRTTTTLECGVTGQGPSSRTSPTWNSADGEIRRVSMGSCSDPALNKSKARHRKGRSSPECGATEQGSSSRTSPTWDIADGEVRGFSMGSCSGPALNKSKARSRKGRRS